MIDYLAIATRCADDLEPNPAQYALLGLSDVELRQLCESIADSAAQDLQIAIDNAFRVGDLDEVGTQVELWRRAA